MLLSKGTIVAGKDGSELKLLSNVSKEGEAKVKVLKAGTWLNFYEEGEVVNKFKVNGGVIYFEPTE